MEETDTKLPEITPAETAPFPPEPAPAAPILPSEEQMAAMAERLREALQAMPPVVPAGNGRPLGIDPELLPSTEKIRLGLIGRDR